MKKEEIIEGMPICLKDGKGLPFCNSVVERYPIPQLKSDQFVAVKGVDYPVHLNDLRPFTLGYQDVDQKKK